MKARRPITRRSKLSDSSPNLSRKSGGTSPPSGRLEGGPVRDERSSVPRLSVPSALQYIHHEWASFESQRSQWTMDKAHLEAQIAFLVGERKGQERLQRDLVCRIKMLEYALQEERAKHGEVRGEERPHEVTEAIKDSSETEDFVPEHNWRTGRELIRQYLKEIGYTDLVLNVTSGHLRSLLRDPGSPGAGALDLSSSLAVESSRGKDASSGLGSLLAENEAEIMAKFEYLATDEDADDERDEEETRKEGSETFYEEFAESDGGAASEQSQFVDCEGGGVVDTADWLEAWHVTTADLALGDLKYFTADDFDDPQEYKAWKISYMLRGHYDSVRALAFHPLDDVLVTASEDHTINVWSLDCPGPPPGPRRDLAPLKTLRGHAGPVTCLSASPHGRALYSGGLDGTVLCWRLPDAKWTTDGDAREPAAVLEGHVDAVWGLSQREHGGRLHLLSCSSDRSVKHWAPEERLSPLSSFSTANDECPTSVDFVRSLPDRMVTAYDTGECIVYDLATGRPLLWLENSACRVNRVHSHPDAAVVVTGGEDGHIRFFDDRTGRLVRTVSGHRESVTSLAIDRGGLYLLSGSHDRTVCLWDCRQKKCIQEIYTHGKKFEESVLDVAFHQARPLMASAGADGFAQVFT